MADQTTERNLCYSMLMRRAPPFILLLGLLFLFMGNYLVRGLLPANSLIFWPIVRWRKEPTAPGAQPAEEKTPLTT